MINDDQNRDIIGYVMDSMDFFKRSLADQRLRSEEFENLYYNKQKDPRDPEREKWRSHIPVPKAGVNILTKVASELDIVMQPDPPFQVKPLSDKEVITAREAEKLLNATVQMNKPWETFGKIFIDKAIHGTAFVKTSFKVQTVAVPMRITRQELEDLGKRIKDAADAGLGIAPDWMSDPDTFEQWRQAVNAANPSIRIPSIPEEGIRTHVNFWGPTFERISPYSMFFDPLIESWDQQPMVVFEVIKPAAWVAAKTGEGPGFPYDPRAVGEALSRWDSDQTERDVKERILNVGQPAGSSPHFYKAVKLWECYRPASEYPFCVVLNETQVINKNPMAMAFDHGAIPISPIRNIIQPGTVLGMSDLLLPREEFSELSTLRSLRLDNAKLHTMPAYAAPNTGMLTDIQKQIYPGAILPLGTGEIKPILGGDVKGSAYQEIASLDTEIDRDMGIGDNVRGATATVGRIPATTDQSRLSQALLRVKTGIALFGSDFRPVVKQLFSLWLQYGFNDAIKPASLQSNPLAHLNQDTLQAALDANLELVGATEVENRALQAQQLMMLGEKFAPLMVVPEQRELLRQTLTILDIRNISKLVSEEGTRIKAQQEMMAMQPPPAPGGPAGPEAPPPPPPGAPPESPPTA